MKSVLGICDLHNGPSLGSLTEKRPLGATTFLGRYGLIDFTLSNFSNSGIDKVIVLVEKNLHSIETHIGSGQVWINNTKLGFQRALVNEKGLGDDKFNTDVANILSNKAMFAEVEADYVVIAPAFFLMSVDYRPFIEYHIASGNDVTVLYKTVNNANEEYINCDSILKGNDGTVLKIFPNAGSVKKSDISLETFVISKIKFLELVEETYTVSRMFNVRDMLRYCCERGMIKVGTYAFNGYVAPILSLENYVKYSFELLTYKNRKQLFSEDWPIYTTTHNTPPALYGANAQVKNSFIANGCIIKGKVENSIISRDVVVEEGASVKNCILFTRTEVGENVKLEYVLSDKNASLVEVKSLKGKENKVSYIHQGARV